MALGDPARARVASRPVEGASTTRSTREGLRSTASAFPGVRRERAPGGRRRAECSTFGRRGSRRPRESVLLRSSGFRLAGCLPIPVDEGNRMAARSGGGSTIGALTTALEGVGLDEPDARRVAADWAAHFPLVGRSGPARVARSLQALGLGSDRALEAAGIMLSLELQVKGAAYQQTLRCIERQGVPGDLARAVAIEAVRLRRSNPARKGSRVRAPVPMTMLPIGVGAAVLVLARILLFVS